jgi:hypothetical protein
MAKPFLQLAAVGVLGVALWKVLSVLLLPLVGTLLGIVLTVLKVALIVGLVFLALWWFRRDHKKDGEAPAS